MDRFFTEIGVFAIVIFILFFMKTVKYASYTKKLSRLCEVKLNLPDECVYKAAQEYAQGKSPDEVKQILLNNVAFDEEMTENIMLLAKPHAAESDGGYNSFIKSVNAELGKAIYKCR